MFSYLLYEGKLINQSYGKSGKEKNSRNISVAHLDLYTKYFISGIYKPFLIQQFL
jgi:hypothetical protein